MLYNFTRRHVSASLIIQNKIRKRQEKRVEKKASPFPGPNPNPNPFPQPFRQEATSDNHAALAPWFTMNTQQGVNGLWMITN